MPLWNSDAPFTDPEHDCPNLRTEVWERRDHGWWLVKVYRGSQLSPATLLEERVERALPYEITRDAP